MSLCRPLRVHGVATTLREVLRPRCAALTAPRSCLSAARPLQIVLRSKQVSVSMRLASKGAVVRDVLKTIFDAGEFRGSAVRGFLKAPAWFCVGSLLVALGPLPLSSLRFNLLSHMTTALWLSPL